MLGKLYSKRACQARETSRTSVRRRPVLTQNRPTPLFWSAVEKMPLGDRAEIGSSACGIESIVRAGTSLRCES